MGTCERGRPASARQRPHVPSFGRSAHDGGHGAQNRACRRARRPRDPRLAGWGQSPSTVKGTVPPVASQQQTSTHAQSGAPHGAGRSDRQRPRVVRLRRLRLLRERHRPAVLSAIEPDGPAAARVRRVRARVRRAADRQPRARRRRRPHRTARAADAVDRADGRRDARSSACCRPTHRSASPRRSCSSLMRVVQGFSLGGEFTGSMVYTTELASPLMRGLVSSSTAAGTTLGFILGSGSAWLVNVHARHRAGVAPGAGAFRSSRASCSASSAGCCAAASTSRAKA